MSSTMQEIETKDVFLWSVLEEMDGFDGILLAQQMYDYIVERRGECPYSVAEIEAWMNEGDCFV